MLLKYVLALAIFVISAFALIPPSRSHRNAATPTIRSDYTAQETVQILDAIEDALLLAKTVVTAPGVFDSSIVFEVLQRGEPSDGKDPSFWKSSNHILTEDRRIQTDLEKSCLG